MRGPNRRVARRRPRRQRRSGLFWGAIGVVAVVVVVVVVNNLGRGGEEVGTLSDPQQVGPVEASATRIDLGQVSLGQWVNTTFRLRNTGPEPVTITIPRGGVEVLEGC